MSHARTTPIDRSPPAPNDVFDVLSNRRRRYALHHLKRHPGPVSLAALSRQVAAWEQGVDPGGLVYEDRKSVHTSLSQFHLPRMTEAGLVEFDPEEGAVRLTESGADVEVYLETVAGNELPWYRYFLLLSVFSVGLVLAGAVSVPGIAAIPDLGLAGVVAVVFLCSSLAFLYDSRNRMRVGAGGLPPEGDD